MFVEFKCDNLKNAIIENYRDKIDKSFDGSEVTQEMMNKFDLLDLDNKGITNLGGIEKATNLRLLYMGNNEVEDISPLKECSKLEI